MDGSVGIWDLDSGIAREFTRIERIVPRESWGVTAVAVTPDGRRALSYGLNGVSVWDVESWKHLRTLKRKRHGAFEFDFDLSIMVTSPDCQRALAGFQNGKIGIWDLESGQLLRSLDAHKSKVTALTVSPDGHWVLSGSEDMTVKAWDLETGRLLMDTEMQQPNVGIVGMGANMQRALGTIWDKVKVWDLRQRQLLLPIPLNPVTGIGDLLCTLELHEHSENSVEVDPDHVMFRFASTSGVSFDEQWFEDSEQSAPPFEPSQRVIAFSKSQPTILAASSDGCRALSGFRNPAAQVWNVESLGKSVRSGTRRNAVAICPTGRRAITGSLDGTIRVWDLQDGRLLFTLRVHEGSVMALAVSLDGHRAVTGADDNTITVTDLEYQRVIGSFTGAAPFTAVAFAGHDRVFAGDDQGGLHWLRICDD